MKKFLRWSVSIGISVGGLWWALKGFSLDEVLLRCREMSHPIYLLAIPMAMGFEYFCRGSRFWWLLRPDVQPRKTWCGVMSGSFFLNSILPFRAGEAARWVWTRKLTDRPWGASGAVLVADRCLDMMSLGLVALWALAGGQGVRMITLSLVIFVGGMMALWKTPHWIQWLENHGGQRKGTLFVKSFLNGFLILRNPRVLVSTFLYTVFFWTVTILLLKWIALLFGISLSVRSSAGVLLALAVGVAMPAAPGYVGTYELAGVTALSALGYSKGEALPFILVFHLFQILGSALWGIPGILWVQKQMASIVSTTPNQGT